MAYKVTRNKDESRAQLNVLIKAFEQDHAAFQSAKYLEAQLRIDFINPFLKTFGWDVDNEDGKTQFMRDVIQEENIDVEEDDLLKSKNPDYTLRIQGNRKLFVEAKKSSIDIEKSSKSTFQTRRYGWNANLGVSLLVNFEKLIVYDCRFKPLATDDPSVARHKIFHFTEYSNRFDELYDLISFEAVNSGLIDDYFSLYKADLNTFDEYFLKQIEKWRTQLANDIIENNSGFDEESINFLIQRLLNRIVFLRICEDREIEKYETLKQIKNYKELKDLFIESDKKYNSGLFDFIEDQFSLKINLKSEILIDIFNELYYPESSYDFSVVDPTILSQIYERYLGSKITIVNEKKISVVEEPEVAASSGVVPTPKLVVNNIVKETLSSLLSEKKSEQLRSLKIADICCGSGTFLISVYDLLLEKIILRLIEEKVTDKEVIYQVNKDIFRLTLKAKQTILNDNIFGVDINPYAVEVTKFSLFLKLLEDENAGSINHYLNTHQQKILPNLDANIKCGNSLVDENYFKYDPKAIENDELLYRVKPFDWLKEFPFLNDTKGFDAIIGNPPYVRIQNMVKYLGDEIKYYQNEISGYTVAQSDTFDKYYLFIQRSLQLINEQGILGYIVPNKFFIAKGGKALRHHICSKGSIFKIIHFGVTQVFPNRSTYTAVLILDKKKDRANFNFRRIKRINTEFVATTIPYIEYKNADYNEAPWIFVSKESKAIFDKIVAAGTISLKTIAEIPVGLQTSADKIYIFQAHTETDSTFKFKKGAVEYEIEKAICKPCLYDLSFELFDTVKANAQIIFPYTIEDDKAEIFSEDYFQANFPLAWAYLNTFKDTLAKRSINGSKNPKWYQFGRSQSLTKFHDTGKLIWPVLSTKASYIFDTDNIQFTGGGNGPYYSLISSMPYSPLYIIAILSHPVFEAMVKSGASEFRGSYYSHGKQFIENLPIKSINFDVAAEKKMHDDIVNIAQQIIEARKKYRGEYIGAKKTILQRKLDLLVEKKINLVNDLYKIDLNEINTVLTDEMFLTDLDEDND